jgi:hypothetical protein
MDLFKANTTMIEMRAIIWKGFKVPPIKDLKSVNSSMHQWSKEILERESMQEFFYLRAN